VITPQAVISPKPAASPDPALSTQPSIAPVVAGPPATRQPPPVEVTQPIELTPKKDQARTMAATPTAREAAPAPKGAPAGKGAPTAPPGGVVVELGTHSTSNFYKGLGGNDVIEHGGIFVATYKVLKIGTTVTLRVLLPGDYEFTASAVVQWVREGGSSEPGYGARFQQISAEGRQLVYRYTRNREPMFYDDL
jgi:uncharacterized protein (TIGR02266 family)